MRKDICDKYGIDYENITTLEQLHDALAIVHENEPTLVCVVPLPTASSCATGAGIRWATRAPRWAC